MKTKLFFALLFAITFYGFPQSKKITKTGDIRFEASVPSFEEVKAQNKTATVILNPENGEIAALALIKGFRFKIALMEEHFNENYIESTNIQKLRLKEKYTGLTCPSYPKQTGIFPSKAFWNYTENQKKLRFPRKSKKQLTVSN